MPSVDQVGADVSPWCGGTRRDVEGLVGSLCATPSRYCSPAVQQRRGFCIRCAICVRCAKVEVASDAPFEVASEAPFDGTTYIHT